MWEFAQTVNMSPWTWRGHLTVLQDVMQVMWGVLRSVGTSGLLLRSLLAVSQTCSWWEFDSTRAILCLFICL